MGPLISQGHKIIILLRSSVVFTTKWGDSGEYSVILPNAIGKTACFTGHVLSKNTKAHHPAAAAAAMTRAAAGGLLCGQSQDRGEGVGAPARSVRWGWGYPLPGRHGPRLWGYPKTGRLFLRTLYSPLNTLSACYRHIVPINSASLPPPPEKSNYFLGSDTGEETAVPVKGFLPLYTLSPLNPL